MAFSSVIGASSVIKPGVVTSSTRPSSPFVGQLIYETDTANLEAYNGSAWVTQNGLQLVKTQTIGSAVSTVTVSDAFSATYENYKIIISGVSFSSLGAAVYLKLNNSTGSTYYGNISYNIPGSTASAVSAQNGGNLGFFINTANHVGLNDMEMVIANPFTVTTTNCFGLYAGRSYNGAFGTHDNNAASSTGFTISPSAGTITGGTIRIYGIANN